MSTCSAQRLRVRGSFIACKLKHRQSSSSTPAADRSIGRVVVSTRRRSTIEAQETRDRRSPVNSTLLVLRIIPGLLLMGHGLQKLVPPGYSPPRLARGRSSPHGAGFESFGIRPAVVAAVLAGSAELVAGSSLAAGLLTPVGTVLVGAVMIRAILKVHVSNGIWAAEGGFEFPLVLLTVGFAITALGPDLSRSPPGFESTTGPASTGRSTPLRAQRSRWPSPSPAACWWPWHPGRRSAPRPTRAHRRRADALHVPA